MSSRRARSGGPSQLCYIAYQNNTIVRRLGAGGGLLYRYRPDESPDGLPGHEGAFVLCSFWLVDNLADQGRLDEAMDLYNSLCDRASPVGLLPEQIDPASGAFLGNYPQAFSHIGVIASGFRLGRLLATAQTVVQHRPCEHTSADGENKSS